MRKKCTLSRMLIWDKVVGCTGPMSYLMLDKFRGDMVLYACIQKITYTLNAPVAWRIIGGTKHMFHSQSGHSLCEQLVLKFSSIV